MADLAIREQWNFNPTTPTRYVLCGLKTIVTFKLLTPKGALLQPFCALFSSYYVVISLPAVTDNDNENFSFTDRIFTL
jgi:hypothetical protein